MSTVTLEHVSCVFGTGANAVNAVDDVSLHIEAGEFFTLLGPSGSGKTTCLRLIGGFTLASQGRVTIGSTDMTDRPAYARPVNTVFQDYALFPHMSVRDNVGYGLLVGGMAKSERRRQADEALEMVRLPGLGDRRPSQLSGGQRQRVALARAIVNKPEILLLDEPLGALDLQLREQMQIELKQLQSDLGMTFLFITHDQHEALSMSDRIGVFNQGRLEQVAKPRDIYERPASRFVAEFVGAANVLTGAAAQKLTGKAAVMIRPERIKLFGPGDQSCDIRSRGVLRSALYLGPVVRASIDVDGIPIVLELQARHQLPAVGSELAIGWHDDAVHELRPDRGGAVA